MKAISVRQPYAWAIVHGIKDVENRTRNIVGKHRGPLLIHASKAVDEDYLRDALAMFDRLGVARPTGKVADLGFGAIVGMVEVWDVHAGCGARTIYNPLGELCSPWAIEGQHHIDLIDARALVEPIPWRGRLGMWDYDGPLPGFWEPGAWIRRADR